MRPAKKALSKGEALGRRTRQLSLSSVALSWTQYLLGPTTAEVAAEVEEAPASAQEAMAAEPEEDRAYGEHEVEDVDAVEPEVEIHGEHVVVGEDAGAARARSNAVVADTDRKRKSDEEDTDEAKKVKLMEMASPHSAASASSVPYSSSRPSTSKPSSFPSTASTSAASSQERKKEGKSLIGILMSGKDLDVGKGFRLFD
jgi:hypothetical protein